MREHVSHIGLIITCSILMVTALHFCLSVFLSFNELQHFSKTQNIESFVFFRGSLTSAISISLTWRIFFLLSLGCIPCMPLVYFLRLLESLGCKSPALLQPNIIMICLDDITIFLDIITSVIMQF